MSAVHIKEIRLRDIHGQTIFPKYAESGGILADAVLLVDIELTNGQTFAKEIKVPYPLRMDLLEADGWKQVS